MAAKKKVTRKKAAPVSAKRSSDLACKTLTVNGKKYVVHELSVRQRNELFGLSKSINDPLTKMALYVKHGCDQFSDYSLDEITNIGGLVFDAITDEVARLSGLLVDEDEKKPVDG